MPKTSVMLRVAEFPLNLWQGVLTSVGHGWLQQFYELIASYFENALVSPNPQSLHSVVTKEHRSLLPHRSFEKRDYRLTLPNELGGNVVGTGR